METSKVYYVDVGAANAVDHKFKEFLKAGRLSYVGFEPDARSTLEFPGQVHPVALGAQREVRTLNLCRKPEVSSFLKPNMRLLRAFHRPERFDVVSTTNVNVVPMDDYFDMSSAYILKLDVQGFELEVLKGATQFLANTVAIEIEVEFWELYEGQPLFGDISAFLEDHGFKFEDFVRLVHWPRPNGLGPGVLTFGQALFVRTLDSFDDLELESKLKAMRLVVEAYGRHDLMHSYGVELSQQKKFRLALSLRAKYWMRRILETLTGKQWIEFSNLG